MSDDGYTTCAKVDDLPEGQIRGVEVDGREIALVNRKGTIFALEDCCSHESFPLSEGELTGDQVTCALHGARFDLESGAPRALPAVKPVKTYSCRVEGDEIQVKVE